MAQLVWASSHKRKRRRFNSHAGPMLGLHVWSPVREGARGDRSTFLSHIGISLPLSPSLPLSLKINKWNLFLQKSSHRFDVTTLEISSTLVCKLELTSESPRRLVKTRKAAPSPRVPDSEGLGRGPSVRFCNKRSDDAGPGTACEKRESSGLWKPCLPQQ